MHLARQNNLQVIYFCCCCFFGGGGVQILKNHLVSRMFTSFTHRGHKPLKIQGWSLLIKTFSFLSMSRHVLQNAKTRVGMVSNWLKYLGSVVF